MIRVLLADDHAVLRDGLRYLLETSSEIEVVGGVGDGEEAVRTAKELSPDVVVMDISMPKLDGITAMRQIIHANGGVKVVILSIQNSDEHVLQALQWGASGYLLKESAGKEVIQAVHTVAAGRRYFSQAIEEMLVQSFIERGGEVQESVDHKLLELLSPREREILKMVVAGNSSVEIGKEMYLSSKTVDTYRSRLMYKLGVEDFPSLIKFAMRNGII